MVWTHGGLLSTQEAIWIGIPIIVMPFFMDQKSNTKILVDKGVGIYLDIKTLSTQSILHAVEEVLYNERYHISCCILSYLTSSLIKIVIFVFN